MIRPPSPSPVPLALVGAGSMASNHARVIAEHPGAELRVVVDADPDRARQLAERYGSAWSTDLAAVTGASGRNRVAAAVVASSTESHPGVAGALLAAGLPLLVEKPLAADLPAAVAMVAASERAGLPLMCGFVERFNPALMTAKALLDGDPVHLLTQRHSPSEPRITTSVVADLLIHDIDLALHLTGRTTVDRVCGSTWTSPAGVIDVGDALLGFSGGVVASLSASRRGQRKNRFLSVSTLTQLVEVDLLRADVTVYRHVRYEASGGAGYRAETGIEIPFVRHRAEPLAAQLQHFLDLVGGRADADAERATLLAPHDVAARVAASAVAPNDGSLLPAAAVPAGPTSFLVGAR